MPLALRLDAILQGPKKAQFPGSNPPPICPRNGFARIKSIAYKSYI